MMRWKYHLVFARIKAKYLQTVFAVFADLCGCLFCFGYRVNRVGGFKLAFANLYRVASTIMGYS
jgi:hypothetical protein